MAGRGAATTRLRGLVSEDAWRRFSAKTQAAELDEVLHRLFDDILIALGKRIDDIKIEDGRSISFFAGGREILTINVGRRELRVYVHPPAGAAFDAEARFEVGRYRLWEGSFRKASGKYHGMSAWVSKTKHLAAMKRIIDHIPATAQRRG
jgi:hypothetical protein